MRAERRDPERRAAFDAARVAFAAYHVAYSALVAALAAWVAAERAAGQSVVYPRQLLTEVRARGATHRTVA